MSTPKFHALKVKDIRKETPDCVSVAFDVPETLADSYSYIPGQYLTLKAQINGEEVRRSYSICTDPEEGLRVAIKKVPDGRFSTFANELLQEGEEVDVMTPMGNFHTPISADNEKNYVAFAAGSGITPIMSIMKAILKREPKSTFMLFFGNRQTESIIFKEEIEALKNKYLGRLSVHHVLSRMFSGNELFDGRIDEEKCRRFSQIFFDPSEVDAFFLCGPEQMIFDVTETLKQLEVDPEKIHFELFTSPAGKLGQTKTDSPKKDFDPASESHVTINLDGSAFKITLPYGGPAILDAALKYGADLPYACKGGVCCTCRAKLVEGEVDMDVNYALEPEEVEAGFILTCQAHPRTPEVKVDFDVR